MMIFRVSHRLLQSLKKVIRGSEIRVSHPKIDDIPAFLFHLGHADIHLHNKETFEWLQPFRDLHLHSPLEIQNPKIKDSNLVRRNVVRRTNDWDAIERRFSGFDQAKNIFGRLSTIILAPLNQKDVFIS
jgi:hypothetical protein